MGEPGYFMLYSAATLHGVLGSSLQIQPFWLSGLSAKPQAVLFLARIGRTLTQAHRLSADQRRKKDAESMKYAGEDCYRGCP